MMSKERELLRRISSHSESRIPAHFIYEIQELLAQPEEGEGVYQKLLRIEDGIEIEILPSEVWLDGYEAGKRSALLSKQPEQTKYVKTKKELEIYFVKDEFGSLRPTFKNPKETPLWIDVLHGGG
jgi:hypothetical protein